MQTNSGSTPPQNSPTDLTGLYLKEIRVSSLLTRDEEVALFKRIERGEHRALRAALRTPQAVDGVADLVRLARRGALKARDLCCPQPDKEIPSEPTVLRRLEDALHRARELQQQLGCATARLEQLEGADLRWPDTYRHLQSIQQQLAECLRFFRLDYRQQDSLTKGLDTLYARLEHVTDAARRGDVHAQAERSHLLGEAGLPEEALRKVAREIRAGTHSAEHARSQIVQAYLRLVVNLARRYQYRGLPLLDLVQEGNIGMMQAVRKFDYRRGYRFSTYASWWIRQAVHRAVADQGHTIRVPVNVYNEFMSLTKAERQLSRTLGREPKVKEIAAMAEVSAARAAYLRGLFIEPVSLDLPVGEQQADRLGDFVPDRATPVPEDEIISRSLSKRLDEMLHELPARHRHLLEERFGLGGRSDHTLSELGEMFHVSRERARQIQCAALEQLGSEENRGVLRDYLAG